MTDLRAARRYAAALFQTALQQNLVESVAADLVLVSDLLNASAELADAMQEPTVPASTKKRVLDSLLSGQIHTLTLDFLKLLIDKQRFQALAAVQRFYRELHDAHRNVVSAQVRSAFPLTEDELARLAEAVGRAQGCRVELEPVVDPSLIGGLVVRVKDTVLDGSVAGQLELLRQRLAGRRRAA